LFDANIWLLSIVTGPARSRMFIVKDKSIPETWGKVKAI